MSVMVLAESVCRCCGWAERLTVHMLTGFPSASSGVRFLLKCFPPSRIMLATNSYDSGGMKPDLTSSSWFTELPTTTSSCSASRSHDCETLWFVSAVVINRLEVLCQRPLWCS